MATATNPRPRVKPARKATLQTIGNVLVLWLTTGKLTIGYQLERIDSELGGTAFRLAKAHQGGNDEPEVYHVLLHGWQTSCDCAGHSYTGHCKHVEGLEALIKAGKIEAPATISNPIPA
jgi:hypothetical protein